MKTSRQMPMGNPADYPIGSPESRAAARAMLQAMRPQRSQLEEDALLLWNALKWYCRAPDWHRPCDQRVSALYSIANSIHDLEDEPVIPQHLRPKGIDHEKIYRLAEIYAKKLAYVCGKLKIKQPDSSVISWEDFLKVEQTFRQAEDTQARAAWARRCPGLEYPFTPEQARKEGDGLARLFWERFEQSAAGIERGYSSDWQPTLKAIVLDRDTRRLLPYPVQ